VRNSVTRPFYNVLAHLLGSRLSNRALAVQPDLLEHRSQLEMANILRRCCQCLQFAGAHEIVEDGARERSLTIEC
jgi:hypothetical protein